jgi:hypothetical protein
MATLGNKMRHYLLLARPGLLALVSWLLVAVPSPSILEWLPPNRYEFGLPRVCVPYTPGTDVVSLVPDLFSALAIAFLCLLLTEIAKTMIAAVPGRRALTHVAFSVYQATLVVDIIRKYAWDWYGYLLYFARLIQLSYDRPRPEVLPVSSPWLSLLALLACMSVHVFSQDRDRPHAG